MTQRIFAKKVECHFDQLKQMLGELNEILLGYASTFYSLKHACPLQMSWAFLIIINPL